MRATWLITTSLLLACEQGACGHSQANATGASAAHEPMRAAASAAPAGAHLPLVVVADVDLPGKAVRLDYQDIDTNRGQLVIAHMNDAAVVVADLRSGSVLKRLTGIPTPRGIAIASDAARIFVTSSPDRLVVIDSASLTEMSRVPTGHGPDGVAWDPAHKTVGVSDQNDGALSLIADAGDGKRVQVALGHETGNVVFDSVRGWFWITVVTTSPPDQLGAVDPPAAKVTMRISLPGCNGAHGLRLHPDGGSAFIACESNSVLTRVDLNGAHSVAKAPTGDGPDVLSIDPGLGWLYVAAESGDLTVFDLRLPGVVLVGHDRPGDNAHSIAVDPTTHRAFFPLLSGPKGTPVLRIMRPSGV